MDNRPIGVFDSGLGGLTCVKELQKLMPNERILYFGDTARVPYGNRSNEVITRYGFQDARLLLSYDVKAVVSACGTVSSVAGDLLKEKMDRPFVGIVEPTAEAACRATQNGKIGIIGTTATIRSGKMSKAILQRRADADILARACPLFVPLVEAGHIHEGDPLSVPAVAYYLEPIQAAGVDTVVLACTHYPILAGLIRAYLGSGVTIIDSGKEAARRIQELLEQQDQLAGQPGGGCHYLVTDTVEAFSQVAELFLGSAVDGKVERVDIAQLEALGGLR